MNILGLSSETSGCGYHRVLMPLGFMQDIKGYVTNWITEDKLGPYDIVIYNRMSPYDLIWNETKDMIGNPKIVFDIDDHWRLPPNHMNYLHYEKNGLRIEENIRIADLITVTNNALAEKCLPFNSNVIVIPNAIPFGRNQFTDIKIASDKIRIFWCGGVTHEPDIAMLRYPIRKLKMYKDKIQMVIGGYTDTDDISKYYWDKMVSSFTDGGTLPYLKIPGAKVNNYMHMYEHADIMLIPLESTPWHSCKSNLKILEAASKRIPCIVSNVEPYNTDKDCPVRWVDSQKDWFSHLNELILNPDMILYEGEKLYQWALKNYNLETINIKRRSAFTDICKA
jgi:glycosyltransferase involved in cell wall biosynthesis